MNKTFLTLTAVGTVMASASWAAGDKLIGNLGKYENQKVVVSGIVTDVDDTDEFTLTDNSGSIEVNLTMGRNDIDEGDYVTVSGILNPTLVDEIDQGRVVILNRSYDGWATSYNKVYETEYTLAGFDANFKANSAVHANQQRKDGNSGVGNNNDSLSDTTGNTSTEVEPSTGR